MAEKKGGEEEYQYKHNRVPAIAGIQPTNVLFIFTHAHYTGIQGITLTCVKLHYL